MPFAVNEVLVAKARTVLARRDDIYWVVGASCVGKSTVCRRLARQTGIALYDADEHIYGGYQSRYNRQRHPASTAWFFAPNPIAWVLSLSPGEFEALNRAVQAEWLDLFADDVAAEPRRPVLVDGGITHPAMLATMTSPARIFCIETTPAERVRRWETADERADMKSWILALPDPEVMWRKFMCFDEVIARTIAAESRAAGIRIFLRNDHTSVEALANTVAGHLGIPGAGSS